MVDLWWGEIKIWRGESTEWIFPGDRGEQTFGCYGGLNCLKARATSRRQYFKFPEIPSTLSTLEG